MIELEENTVVITRNVTRTDWHSGHTYEDKKVDYLTIDEIRSIVRLLREKGYEI